MTFRDIERILRALLPASARLPQWWGNKIAGDSGNVQSRSWTRAGYDAHLISEERILFKRRG